MSGPISPTPFLDKAITKQARFAIYTNGTKRIFTDPKYHNQSEIVFIPTEAPNTIVVKRKGVTWGDFFKTLPMKVEQECLTTGTGQEFCTDTKQSLKFYVNGESVPNALNRTIEDTDTLIITYGPKNDPSIPTQLNQ